jgi:hypothetical protein
MLEESAVERLSPDGVVEEGYESAGLRGQRPKLLTYFQLCLKPHVDVRSRGCRELAVTRSLDLLREGRLTELADVLAGRLMAVDTAGRQGWNTAKHLEVCCEEDEGVAPSHVLLAAQRHARQVEKAGGKGSWPRSGGWGSSDWAQETKGKGQNQGCKGQDKERKRQIKRRKSQLGRLAKRRKRQDGGEAQEKGEGET